ncbi:hypothetical protein [Trichlorobacter lovleyi]|uniref:Uncharacterized protein n=1 Tax=Trichlorobacter lovleyi (strain ATCC BAA-1151 / DSM 17278 / SZ) TaxID=398767 RepID=B3E5H6_TRIL1|nr:hypothetical protein [Trichlorobacter lovleyi]ACD94647.1 hypothetical protein Glov_0924 [Trichlorobacter lovleyi SZ]
MFKSKFEDNELTILIEEPVQKELMFRGINPVEVCRLIESFSSKIMASKKDEQIQITNEDTKASLALDVKWETENKVSVQVSIVNLDDLTLQEKPKSKVDLADFPAGPLPFDAPAEQ